jgi:phosphoribosyl-ATP pyrophosphohydrolase/phosphoribosyl-AMP cyclohydrolase
VGGGFPFPSDDQAFSMKNPILERVKFDERGLVPAVARDYSSGVVLMLAYQNAEALEKTLATGEAWYFSRSRNKLWKKGETSGHLQQVRDVRIDCDGDTVLLLVEQTGPACHTGAATCFYTGREGEGDQPPAPGAVLGQVYQTILSRRGADAGKSYVKSLFEKGPEAVFAKVSEEAGELIDASRRQLPRKELVHEAADLLFHSLVLLAQHDVHPDEVMDELRRRMGRSGIEEKASRPPKKTEA